VYTTGDRGMFRDCDLLRYAECLASILSVFSDFWGSLLNRATAADLDISKLWQVGYFSSSTS
jgi:hypothetical protein